MELISDGESNVTRYFNGEQRNGTRERGYRNMYGKRGEVRVREGCRDAVLRGESGCGLDNCQPMSSLSKKAVRDQSRRIETRSITFRYQGLRSISTEHHGPRYSCHC